MNLTDAVGSAIGTAGRLNRKVIVSYTRPWHCPDLLNFVACQGGEHRFFWQRGGVQLGGGGRLWGSVAGFADWPSRIREILAGWQGVCPYFWGGLAFAGDSTLILPRWLVRRGRESELTVWEWVAPNSSVGAVVAQLESLMAQLEQGPTSALGVGGGESRSVVDCSPGWRGSVAAALEAIGRGQLEKVVLSRAVEILGSGDFSAFGLLEQLRGRGGDCIWFLAELEGGKTFVGATPELLLEFSWQNDRLHLRSDALAGSSALGELLLQSQKDLGEHQAVIDSIVAAYHQVGAKVGQIKAPQLLELQHIQHLHTPIVGTRDTSSWQDVFQLLARLHPTAAVGGKPRERALQFIQQFEDCDRGGYAAPIGWFNGRGEGEFAVAIRSGYVEKNRVKMFAGAGIVRDSQIDREWDETNLKLLGMLEALGLGKQN